MPRAGFLIVGIVAGDFLNYFGHVARHRYDFLWQFHAVHHSQRELNFFSNDRFHEIDTFADMMIRIFPLALLSPRFLDLGIYYTVSLVLFRLQHCPIRTNYGWLRYILVTPQSHRIHHASEARQQNSNFGSFFSIWDHIFGTQYESYDEYAENLGLKDLSFPI